MQASPASGHVNKAMKLLTTAILYEKMEEIKGMCGYVCYIVSRKMEEATELNHDWMLEVQFLLLVSVDSVFELKENIIS